MGTPGDKADNIGKIVQKSNELAEDPNRELLSDLSESAVVTHILQERTTTITTTTTTSIAITATTTTTEMTIAAPLQQFVPYTILSHVKPEPSYEQAFIEDYYSQTKLYQSQQGGSGSGISKKPSVVSQEPAEAGPGPSGLQSVQKEKVVKKVHVHVCQLCQKTFSNASKLSKHQSSHGTGSFKCENCKKTFTSKFKLVRHALIHSDRKPFSCSVCDRTFHRKDHLKNHIKVHSPSKKHYVCERADCKKEYTSLLSFKKHSALHAAEEGSLVCQVCHRSFQTKEEILFHLKVHAGSRTVKNPNEKKFTCDYCDRKFFTRKDVRRHLVVHTGMRDFLCQFCPQRFGRKDHLVRHIKKSHSKELEQQKTSVVPGTSQQNIQSIVVIPGSISPSGSVSTSPGTRLSPAFPTTTTLSLSPSTSGTSRLVKLEPVYVKTETTTELIKSEDTEGSADTQLVETFDPIIEVGSLLFSQELPEINIIPDTLEFLPGPSTQKVLKELENEESAGDNTGSSTTEMERSLPPVPLLEEPVFSDHEILQLLQSADEDKNIPLPGFSQTFQSPPPQPPPKPPPRH